jgi:hypothetical protein
VIVELALAAALTAAPRPTSPDWDALARCESSGNWHINTGNGYSGGLQFLPSTWRKYKPAGAPAQAHQATKAQQIEAGRRVLKAQGPKAWPTCSRKTGWYKK